MKSLAVSLSLAVLVFGSCNRIPLEYREFVELPLSKQHEVLRQLPIEKRIDYYLAAMQYNEPPGVGLADDIAIEGKPALPLLMKRLSEEKDEHKQVHIIRIFEFMHSRHHRLRDETEVVNLLRQKSDEMKNAWCKQRTDEALRYIQTDQLPDIERELQKTNTGR